MSNKLQGQIWDLDIKPAGKKLVLLAFADAANDDGITWIAVQSQRGKRDILRKSSQTLRAVQGHIAELESEGHLERIEKPGKGCLWIVRATPAGFAGVWGPTPAENAATPADFAGKPSLTPTDKESARPAPPEGKCPISGAPLPAGLSLAQWEAFLDMRFAIAKPVKLYVAGILLQKLADMAGKWVAGDVVDRSTVNGWPDLYEPEDGRVTGVRRVVAGNIAEPVGGYSEQDRAELARIAAIEDFGQQMEARRAYFERADRRNAPDAVSRHAGELPLGPPVKQRKA